VSVLDPASWKTRVKGEVPVVFVDRFG